MSEAKILREGVFYVQVCIPTDWTDDEIRDFAEQEYPSGTQSGWLIKEDLGRVPCLESGYKIHVVLVP